MKSRKIRTDPEIFWTDPNWRTGSACSPRTKKTAAKRPPRLRFWHFSLQRRCRRISLPWDRNPVSRIFPCALVLRQFPESQRSQAGAVVVVVLPKRCCCCYLLATLVMVVVVVGEKFWRTRAWEEIVGLSSWASFSDSYNRNSIYLFAEYESDRSSRHVHQPTLRTSKRSGSCCRAKRSEDPRLPPTRPSLRIFPSRTDRVFSSTESVHRYWSSSYERCVVFWGRARNGRSRSMSLLRCRRLCFCVCPRKLTIRCSSSQDELRVVSWRRVRNRRSRSIPLLRCCIRIRPRKVTMRFCSTKVDIFSFCCLDCRSCFAYLDGRICLVRSCWNFLKLRMLSFILIDSLDYWQRRDVVLGWVDGIMRVQNRT